MSLARLQCGCCASRGRDKVVTPLARTGMRELCQLSPPKFQRSVAIEMDFEVFACVEAEHKLSGHRGTSCVGLEVHHGTAQRGVLDKVRSTRCLTVEDFLALAVTNDVPTRFVVFIDLNLGVSASWVGIPHHHTFFKFLPVVLSDPDQRTQLLVLGLVANACREVLLKIVASIVLESLEKPNRISQFPSDVNVGDVGRTRSSVFATSQKPSDSELLPSFPNVEPSDVGVRTFLV
mmetsp:Transcript_34837/g.68439  ORF Transcript_34837/g.68439 Transcript_34837/m.68439 type:complete len:234 (-) Transcript_34837:4788-5489(-)